MQEIYKWVFFSEHSV